MKTSREYGIIDAVAWTGGTAEGRVRRFDDETDLLDIIYRGVTDGSALGEALDALRARYDCDGGAFVLLDLKSPASDIVLVNGTWSADVAERYREVAAFDPAPQAFALLPKGTASTTDRLFAQEFKESSFFWNEFYRPSGFTETLGAALFAEDNRFAVLGLHRSEGRAAFDADEVADLERILPHLIRTFQLRRSFIRLEARSLGFEDIVDQLETGVVLLDASGKISFANLAARAVFCRNDGIGLDRAGRLMIGPADARSRMADLIASIGHCGAGGTMSVRRADAAQGYALLVAPAPAAGDDWFAAPFGTGRAIVLIHDPDRRPRDAAAILQSALGLTPSAARLVAALAADDDLKSFAEANGVTIHTARFHLRAALARTQTGTQAELVRLAVRLLRDFTLRGT